MKKFFCAIFSFVLVSLLCFSGCSPATTSDESNKQNQWIEVQSITYCIKDGEEKTLTSTVYRNIVNNEQITQEEFENAPEEQKELIHNLDIYTLEVSVNRKEMIKDLNSTVGKTIYSWSYAERQKFVIKSYEFRYVKIHFVDNGGMEINYYETSDNLGFTTINVLPVSYEITYFND